MNTTGRGTAPPPFTTSEELALANNEGRPMMVGVEGGMSSDPTASTSKAFVMSIHVLAKDINNCLANQM